MQTEEQLLQLLEDVSAGEVTPVAAYNYFVRIVDDACAKAREEVQSVNSTDSIQE